MDVYCTLPYFVFRSKETEFAQMRHFKTHIDSGIFVCVLFPTLISNHKLSLVYVFRLCIYLPLREHFQPFSPYRDINQPFLLI
jgi:hypothetical protein